MMKVCPQVCPKWTGFTLKPYQKGDQSLSAKDSKRNGGGGGNRTRVRKHLNTGYYMLSTSFNTSPLVTLLCKIYSRLSQIKSRFSPSEKKRET